MKKIILFTVCAMAMFFTAMPFASAKDIEKKYSDLKDFTRILVKNTAVGLDVKIGKKFSVKMKGHEDRLEELTLKVRGDELVIMEEEEGDKNFRFNDDVKVTIVMPSFTGLEVNGAVDADIEGIEDGTLDFEINGAANIEIEGRCERLNVEMNGAGNFEGRPLECKHVNMQINGAGNAEVYASKSVNAEVSGIGNIDVYGKPKDISKDVSLLGNIDIH